ncbi:MAG: 50S ribosomal protein L23 [Candidatus Margulisbacteria bacterium]|nr:50S ribosomal protein L23 [Candidatus Margulisiibacteriota bacterium]
MIKNVILGPVITEKSSAMGAENKYVFKVLPDANKIEIKSVIEKTFKVEVLNVRTINVLGKNKRVGKFTGRTSDWKKAIVTIKEGQKIAEFEKLS